MLEFIDFFAEWCGPCHAMKPIIEEFEKIYSTKIKFSKIDVDQNQEMASKQFGVDLAGMRAGSAADLVVLDYRSPTPLTAGNLAWHFLFGLNSACVESVMVAGRFVIRNRQPAFGVRDVYEKARQASKKLWAKL